MNENYHVAIAFDATGAITACKAQVTDEGISDKVNFSCLYDESIYNALRVLKYKVNKILYRNKYKMGKELVDTVFNDKDLLNQIPGFTACLNSYMELLLPSIGNNSTIYLLELTKDDLIAISTPSFKAQNKHRFYRQLGMCVPDYFVFTMFIINHIIKKFAKEHGYNIVSVKRKAQAARCFFCGKLHIEDLELPIQNLRKYKNLKSVKEANRNKLLIATGEDGSFVQFSTVEYASVSCFFDQTEAVQRGFKENLFSTMHITINMLRDIFPGVKFDLDGCFKTIYSDDMSDILDIEKADGQNKKIQKYWGSATPCTLNSGSTKENFDRIIKELNNKNSQKPTETKKKRISIMDL